jgi:hypothetical protein
MPVKPDGARPATTPAALFRTKSRRVVRTGCFGATGISSFDLMIVAQLTALLPDCERLTHAGPQLKEGISFFR